MFCGRRAWAVAVSPPRAHGRPCNRLCSTSCKIVHGVLTGHSGACLARQPSRMLCIGSRGKTSLLCPKCHSDSARRSRRSGVKDYIIGLALLRPWRCRNCDLRFYAWAVPVAYVTCAHCDMCGNMDLQRISREHGAGSFAWLYRLLHFPTYRCAPCRNRFFSIRTYRRIVPTPESPVTKAEKKAESHPVLY